MKTKFTFAQFKDRYVKHPTKYVCVKNTKSKKLMDRGNNVVEYETGNILFAGLPLLTAIYLKDYYNMEDEYYLKQIYHYWCDHPF